jgi:cell division protein FtsB
LEVSVSDNSGYVNGRIKMRLAPTGVDALVSAASADAQVKARQTTAEDLAQPLADVARQVAMLNGYRDRLSTLLARKDTSVTDLISVSKELAATQTQLEQLTSQNAQLRRRVDTDLLTISWQVTATQARSAGSPVGDAMRSFGANFREAIGSVIEFLAQLIPWLVIGLPALVLLRVFWRWTGNWLSHRVRTG